MRTLGCEREVLTPTRLLLGIGPGLRANRRLARKRHLTEGALPWLTASCAVRIPFWNWLVRMALRVGTAELTCEKITKNRRTMSNIEQTAKRRADNFLSDVGGIHTMPEQKRFRGRHRVYTPRGGQW